MYSYLGIFFSLFSFLYDNVVAIRCMYVCMYACMHDESQYHSKKALYMRTSERTENTDSGGLKNNCQWKTKQEAH